MSKSKIWIAYAAILAGGAGIGVLANFYWAHEYDLARQHYVDAATASAEVVSDRIESAFSSIYDNIRTLSLLPSLREVDRHGTNLSAEAQTTFQQVYNNLASSVDVSEVYVLPVDFDPEKVDTVTGEPEAPILAYDQLIVERPGDAAQADIYATTGQPELEIYEYHLLQKQLAWLKANYPTIDKIDGMKVPMISGPAVITCDNRTFNTTLVDADRKGLIQLVPFYGSDGKLRGGVAAIMLSNAYRALMPDRDYALINTGYDYVTPASADGEETLSADWVKSAKPNSALIYSDVRPLNTADVNSPWQVWSGHPNAEFEAGADATQIRYSLLASFAVIALLTLAGIVMLHLMDRNLRAAQRSGAELERRVAERTAEIQNLAAAADKIAAGNAARIAETTALNAQMSGVVGAALAGDFSARIATGLTDDGLNTLAQNVNSLVASVDRSIAETGTVLSALARTDLTLRVEGDYAGALAQLKTDTNSVADRLTEVVHQLRAASGSVRKATGEILSGTNDLADRTAKQAASIEETSAAVENLDTMTLDIAKRANSANAKANAVAQTAESTGKIMGLANDAMGRISASSAKISNVISLIDDIAFQTNLLALNASVEAARAGEAGKGFAVVAVEVRRLAQSAAQASSEVKVLIEQAATEVTGGNKLVADATQSLGTMLDGIRENRELVGGIAQATKDQSSTISEISSTVKQIDEMTQHNAALVQQTNAAIEQTEGQANDLDRLVDIFVIDERAGSASAGKQVRAA